MNSPIIPNTVQSSKLADFPDFGREIRYKLRGGREVSYSYQGRRFALLRQISQNTPVRLFFDGQSIKNTTRCCMWSVIGDFATIRESVKDDGPTGKHFWSSVVACNSVHTCPVCSARRRANKSAEIQALINAHLREGGCVFLVTLTFSHKARDSLRIITDRMKDADRAFSDQRRTRSIQSNIGWIGTVKNIEFTYGEDNGWHPHTHQLWFTDSEICPDELKALLFPEWEAACIRRGLGKPSFKRGMDIRMGESAAEYMTKTGIDPDKDLAKEIARTDCKLANGERLTPWGIAGRLGTDSRYLALWAEYAIASKGKNIVTVSKKLRDKYPIEPMDDDSESLLKAKVLKDNYKIIIKNGLLYEALALFDEGGTANDLTQLLEGIDYE